jgi:uncharacterized protein YegP (UPF0339 family)
MNDDADTLADAADLDRKHAKENPEPIVPPLTFETYQDTLGEHRFRIRARNGEIVAHGESYKNERDMLATIKLLQRACAIADVRAEPDDDPEQDG